MPVINLNSGEPFDVYAGSRPRAERLAAALTHLKDAPVEGYNQELWALMKADEGVHLALAELDGTTIACHCAIEPCRSHTLLAAAAWAKANPLPAPARHDLVYPSHLEHWVEQVGLQTAPRVLICGSTDFGRAELVTEVVDELAPGTLVIEGEARGADALARDAAMRKGLPVAGFPADWRVKHSTPANRVRTGRYGPYDVGAGLLRNRSMVQCGPGHVYAFVIGEQITPGTANTVQLAQEAKIPVTVVRADGSRELLA